MPLIRSSSMLFGRLCFVAVSAALLAVLPQSAGQASAAGSCPTAAAFTAGDGSAGNAFEISTPGHLQYMHDNVQTNHSERVLAAQRAWSVADYLRAKGMPGTVRVGASIPTRLDSWAARRAEVSVTMA